MNVPGPRVKHVCPKCGTEVERVTAYGQKSYLCTVCNEWAPWKHRRSVSLKTPKVVAAALIPVQTVIPLVVHSAFASVDMDFEKTPPKRCRKCRKVKGDHQARSFHCPVGSKSRCGYTQFHHIDIFTP